MIAYLAQLLSWNLTLETEMMVGANIMTHDESIL